VCVWRFPIVMFMKRRYRNSDLGKFGCSNSVASAPGKVLMTGGYLPYSGEAESRART
jgi:hypothetical protein